MTDSAEAMIQTSRAGKALVSTRRHGPLRNSRAPTEHYGPRKWESRAYLWDMKKAVSHVFAAPAILISEVRGHRDQLNGAGAGCWRMSRPTGKMPTPPRSF